MTIWHWIGLALLAWAAFGVWVVRHEIGDWF